jgi:hypothetical protein
MERRPERSDSAGNGPRSETIVDARTSLALWLRAGRTHRGMSLDDVAKVTKIQPRILERLETGRLDGLPAEVFVRGFVRSFARCVGLDEGEALRRHAACGLAAGSSDLTPTVRALVEAMVDLAPGGTTAPRATPRRMQAVEALEGAAGSMRDLPASGAVVETMMLPLTGTVVLPALSPVVEVIPERGSGVDVLPPVIAADVDVDVPAEPVDLLVSPTLTGPPPTDAAAVAVEPVGGFPAAGELSRKKRTRRGKGRGKRAIVGPAVGLPREPLAMGTPVEPSPIVTAPELSGALEAPGPDGGAPAQRDADAALPIVRQDAARAGEVAAGSLPAGTASDVERAAAPGAGLVTDEPIATATWAPKMPPIAATSSVPWRRPAYAAAAAAAVPSLVIDDADPDSAERVLEERAEHHTPRRSFLPPILLDREDRSGRQGGLTLAVIILLIAATLTLSYLMRRPSASGDGMTRLEPSAGPVWAASPEHPGVAAAG